MPAKSCTAFPNSIWPESIQGDEADALRRCDLAGSYIADSGANISALSHSEAGRVGLKISNTSSKSSEISGISRGAQVTEISDSWVGKTHLKHVASCIP